MKDSFLENAFWLKYKYLLGKDFNFRNSNTKKKEIFVTNQDERDDCSIIYQCTE